MPAPKQATNMTEETESSCGFGRKAPSTLGLLIVSGLNVICLAFIIYHFADHPKKMESAAFELTVAARDSLTATMPERARPLGGNIDFALLSTDVVSIASGIDYKGKESAEKPRDKGNTGSETASPTSLIETNDDESREHWVQLGALSEERTARRYWSVLQERHAPLLQNHEPGYFSPLDVGGSLYHIRLGPMTGDVASELCDRLQAEGADCFCISSNS